MGKPPGKGRSAKGKKLSVTKRGNIKNNKLRKQGLTREQIQGKELKASRKWRRQNKAEQAKSGPLDYTRKSRTKQSKEPPPEEPVDEETESEDEEQMTLGEEELEYLKNLEEGTFLQGIDNDPGKKAKPSRKSKVRAVENSVPAFELMPRIPGETPETAQAERELKRILPIKEKGVVKKQYREMDGEEDAEKEGLEGEDTKEEEAKQPALPEVSTVLLFAERQRKLSEKKAEIARHASLLIEDPEANIRKLKTLRSLLLTNDPDIVVTVRKLVMISLVEVFKDITPGYRVTDWSEKEETVKLSKEVKQKRGFEEGLLSNYRKYLEFLEDTVREGESRKGRWNSQPKNPRKFVMSKDAKVALAEVACKCLCVLLDNMSHFNYRTNVISLIVAMMFFKNKPISDASTKCMSRFFQKHKVEDGIDEAVTFISKKIKGQRYRVEPKVLDTFLSLRIRETNLRREDESAEEAKKRKQERKEKISKMTRTEKRFQKRQEELQKEQQAAEQSLSMKKKLQLNTEIIQQVFATYFRILKTACDSRLLPSVLEGLARFAHLINIEFFDDLIKVLGELVVSEVLQYRESLNCVLTAFKVLADQGASLNIDPTRFYAHLYYNLFSVHAGGSAKDAAIILRCMDAMVFKRHKHISIQRALAYIKRLGTLSVQSLPNACLAFLCTLRAMIKLYPKSDILLDSETLGSGVFLPELEEPEHCNAQNTALWELHLLRNHYHPTVGKYAFNLIKKLPVKGEGALDPALTKLKPLELLEEYDTSMNTFNPPVLTKPLSKVKGSKDYQSRSYDEYLQPSFQSLAEEYLTEPENLFGKSLPGGIKRKPKSTMSGPDDGPATKKKKKQTGGRQAKGWDVSVPSSKIHTGRNHIQQDDRGKANVSGMKVVGDKPVKGWTVVPVKKESGISRYMKLKTRQRMTVLRGKPTARRAKVVG